MQFFQIDVGVLAGQREKWPFWATRSSLISCNYAGRYNSPRIPRDIPDCYGFQTEESVKIRSIHLIHGESFAGLYLHALQKLAYTVRLDNVDDDFSASVLVL
jgi:hypothetical protein